MEGYWSLVVATGKISDNRGLTISRDEYKNGYMITVLDLTPTQCGDNMYADPKQTGDVHIALTFKQNLANPINAFVYLEHESKIVVNKTRQVTAYF